MANANEVAVMGTYNSGCAKIEVPILNQDPNGPMLMVSQANTNPGLTKTWDPGEPDKYYPTGKRNYARVVTTDDNQGRAAAQFMAKDLGVKKCYILNDNETYGQGVAKAFADRGRPSRASRSSATTRGTPSSPTTPRCSRRSRRGKPDCIYLGGIFDNNGGQLIKDKVAVLGRQRGGQADGPRRLHRLPGAQQAA